MIDVMMFLLFFFMVASLAMVVQNALPVSLPKASTADQEKAPPITITLQADGGVYLNTTRITIDRLRPMLENLKVSAKTLVTLNSDERVPYGTVVAAMDEARKAGVTTFGFATNRK
jgi:biopolymer transport protein ExbD